MTQIQLPNGGIFSLKTFERFIGKTLRAKRFEDLSIPTHIVATDFDSGKSVDFFEGTIIHPVVASCSIPVLFNPKKIKGVNYVDGGVLKNLPASTIREQCDYLIGINVSPLVVDDYKLSLIQVAQRTYQFMFKANITHDKTLCDLLIEPVDMVHYDMFDLEKGREIFESGYQSAKKVLAESNLKIV